MVGDETWLRKARDELFSGDDRSQYLHIGFFITWFSAVEIRISMLLALATLTPRMEGFELLTRGMDARVKLERLRKACDADGLFKIGPNLAARLNVFEKTSLPLRNKLSHSFLTTDPNYDSVHLSSISRLPYAAYGMQPQGKTPEQISFLELFERGLWLSYFQHDLAALIQDVLKNKAREGTLEIGQPRSPLPQESNPHSGQPKQPSNAGKRARRRQRKGLPQRGKPKP